MPAATTTATTTATAAVNNNNNKNTGHSSYEETIAALLERGVAVLEKIEKHLQNGPQFVPVIGTVNSKASSSSVSNDASAAADGAKGVEKKKKKRKQPEGGEGEVSKPKKLTKPVFYTFPADLQTFFAQAATNHNIDLTIAVKKNEIMSLVYEYIKLDKAKNPESTSANNKSIKWNDELKKTFPEVTPSDEYCAFNLVSFVTKRLTRLPDATPEATSDVTTSN